MKRLSTIASAFLVGGVHNWDVCLGPHGPARHCLLATRLADEGLTATTSPINGSRAGTAPQP
jgi:hypothetical protein